MVIGELGNRVIDWRLVHGVQTIGGMGEIAEQLKARTMKFALDVCALIQQLPNGEPGWTVQHQLTKAATSVAFNYRAACRGRSHAEYTAKIGLVRRIDETLGWRILEARLLAEGRELAAIMSSSYGTARYKEQNRSGRQAKNNG